jgi:hypothetical protein
VLAVGEAGIGKTALLRRFTDSVADPARVLWAACDHLFTPRPLGPFLDLADAVGGQLAARVTDAAGPYDVAASAAAAVHVAAVAERLLAATSAAAAGWRLRISAAWTVTFRWARRLAMREPTRCCKACVIAIDQSAAKRDLR